MRVSGCLPIARNRFHILSLDKTNKTFNWMRKSAPPSPCVEWRYLTTCSDVFSYLQCDAPLRPSGLWFLFCSLLHNCNPLWLFWVFYLSCKISYFILFIYISSPMYVKYTFLYYIKMHIQLIIFSYYSNSAQIYWYNENHAGIHFFPNNLSKPWN